MCLSLIGQQVGPWTKCDQHASSSSPPPPPPWPGLELNLSPASRRCNFLFWRTLTRHLRPSTRVPLSLWQFCRSSSLPNAKDGCGVSALASLVWCRTKLAKLCCKRAIFKETARPFRLGCSGHCSGRRRNKDNEPRGKCNRDASWGRLQGSTSILHSSSARQLCCPRI